MHKPSTSLLKELRDKKGVTLREAARELQIDPSFLLRVERGERSASRDVRQRAANYYAVAPEALQLDGGDVPEDVIAILREHPEALDRLRNEYG